MVATDNIVFLSHPSPLIYPQNCADVPKMEKYDYLPSQVEKSFPSLLHGYLLLIW